MYRALLVMLCLLFLCASGLIAEDSKLSPDAQKAEAAYQDRLTKVMQSAQSDIEKKKADLQKNLDKELKSVMRDGNFEQATAVKKAMEDLEKEDPLYDAFGKDALLVKKAQEKEKARSYRIKVIAAVASAPMTMKRYYVQKTVQSHIDEGNYEIKPSTLLTEETGMRMGILHLSYTINGGKNIVKEINWYQTEQLIPEEMAGE
jgi:hypothetical protein